MPPNAGSRKAARSKDMPFGRGRTAPSLGIRYRGSGVAFCMDEGALTASTWSPTSAQGTVSSGGSWWGFRSGGPSP